MADQKISALAELSSADDADVLPIVDTSVTTTKKITWANIKSVLKTYFDTIYTLANLGGVPTSRTVNTKALSSNITLTQDDVGDGTTNKAYTATEKTKLSGVEASADVTDAGNVGSSIHGASAKTSMVDADKIAIIDTEASNVLKTLTWAYVKSILKTYFDTLYNKYVHPNHSGDVTSVADGAQTIAAKAVTLAKMNDLAQNTIIGRITASTGVPEALSAANVRTIINVADGATANAKATGAEIDTGTDDAKYATAKAMKDSGYLSGMGDVTAASDSAAGKVELATTAETDTGTDTGRAVTPDGLAGSIHGLKQIQIKIFDDATALATGDGKLILMIPEALNGMNLVKAHAAVTTVSSSGTPIVQIRNITDSVDMLSTRITIDANENTSYTAATAPVIDTTKDDVATGDLIAIDVDGAGTGAKGLIVYLAFQTP